MTKDIGRLQYLEVAKSLHSNSAEVSAAGYENTAQTLIELAQRATGLDSLADVDILDVGCGVRFTMAIINRAIPIRSYSGLEVDQPIIDFLKSKVERHDDRFHFERWDARNQRYNKDGFKMQATSVLPFAGSFDLIWLFSVFTHLEPVDAAHMLVILRKHIRPAGKLFFSAFIDDDLDGFEDRVPDKPLFTAYYGRGYMTEMIRNSGWRIDSFNDKELHNWIQHYIVCSPL